MNNTVRQKLCEIITQYGVSLCEKPQRQCCEGLLRDFCPEDANRGEIHVLVTTLEAGVPINLAKAKGIPVQVTMARLTRNIIDDYGLSEEVARWAVESWALAIGVVEPSKKFKVLEIGDLETAGVQKWERS